jgi:hypothetical protein
LPLPKPYSHNRVIIFLLLPLHLITENENAAGEKIQVLVNCSLPIAKLSSKEETLFCFVSRFENEEGNDHQNIRIYNYWMERIQFESCEALELK